MDGGFYTISLTAKNMYLSWSWMTYGKLGVSRRLTFYTGTIYSWVCDGRHLTLEIVFPIRVFKKERPEKV